MRELPNHAKKALTLGIISDTHIPDRARSLHPGILPLFRDARVRAILHAGDISIPSVLAELAQVAPVYAVRGNRDILWRHRLPLALKLNFNGIEIGLAHGHGGWRSYLVDRTYFMFHGYHHERLLPRLLAEFPQADVIVFGHGHLPLNCWMDDQLLFNPGSPHFPEKKDLAPSVGFLHISAESEVRGEIVTLNQAIASPTL
jgi:putative phosphoesterase